MQSACQCVQYRHASLSCSTMALNSWTSTSAVYTAKILLNQRDCGTNWSNMTELSLSESTLSFDAIMLPNCDAPH